MGVGVTNYGTLVNLLLCLSNYGYENRCIDTTMRTDMRIACTAIALTSIVRPTVALYKELIRLPSHRTFPRH